MASARCHRGRTAYRRPDARDYRNEDRLQGTVVADVVNSASRIEGLTKRYGASTTISEAVMTNLNDPARYHYRFVDKVLVDRQGYPGDGVRNF